MHHPDKDWFDATGARYREGRWHSLGTIVLYTAEHISLAALETLIHSSGKEIPPRTVTDIEIPHGLRIEDAPRMDIAESRAYGDGWARSQRTVALKVPSIAAYWMESNYVLNPRHPDFPKIAGSDARPFLFDRRFIHFP